MKIINKKIWFIICITVTAQANAFDWNNFKKGYATVQVGEFYASQGKAQDIGIESLIGDRYTYSNNASNNVNALFGLGYFINGFESDAYGIDIGVNVFYLSNTVISGKIIQEHLYPNLTYQYQISHAPLYVDAKANIKLKNTPAYNYALTLDAGIGPNFMITSRFHDASADNGETLPDHAFSGKTTTQFSATAGIGVKITPVSSKTPIECGYRFFYLGQGNLSKNTPQLENSLNTGTVYANALMCGIDF